MKKIVLICLLLGFAIQAQASLTEQEKNKEVVTQFYQKAINNKDFSAAEVYLGPWYIQHNPLAKDGIEGLKQYIDYLKQAFPESHSEIKRVMAEGDYVILHVHSIKEPGTHGQAIIDIFRLEKNKIVEHWDVIQTIPAESANSNGMF
ncbi:Predicted ester cyclase [Legionella beliardensis]|uniref:Predicted ester cyclase n=1 Tax=Legionella beliardensis TaxID=91822 RepID=A0A378I0C5_9GAMM|nr:ester cyclase [Legionella beliardensis]STX28160.1 Predicted ester cyclase [Legionella beliardensis]